MLRRSSALEKIRELRPDLLLLDIQMPGMDGFELLRALSPDELPAVVFVTAYDEHAVRAFEARALDYLLKPTTRARLAEALRRARERLATPKADAVRRRCSICSQSARAPPRASAGSRCARASG
jgi:two-component system LytT family response regulator